MSDGTDRALWNELTPFAILTTDRRFTDSPDAGDPRCICSRCLAVIEERCAPPIRAFGRTAKRVMKVCSSSEATFEYRFHPHCLGAVPCCSNDEDDELCG